MTKSFDNRDGWIWMDGSFIPWKKATSHIITQGLHYASTVFEGERLKLGRAFNADGNRGGRCGDLLRGTDCSGAAPASSAWIGFLTAGKWSLTGQMAVT